MSAKRYFLIAAALWAFALSAQMTTWVYGSGYHFKTTTNRHLTGYDINKVIYVPLGAYNLELENRFVYIDRLQDDRYENVDIRQDRVDEKMQLSLSRKWDKSFAKVFYRGEFYNQNLKRDFFLNETPDIFARRTYNQQAGGKATFDYDTFYGNIQARERTFFYNYVPDHESEILETSNINASATAGYRIIKPVSVFVTATDKKALDKRSNLYDYASGGIGVTFDSPLMPPVGYLSASSRVEWYKGDRLSIDFNPTTFFYEQTSKRMIPVTSDMRYTVMASQQVMGYVSYVNRSFYDREAKEMLYNSQFLRGSCKYSFPYDASAASFVEVAAKYSPEKNFKNRSSMIFAKSEMKVFDRFYLGAGINHTELRVTRYEGVARFFLTPWNEIFVDYVYTNDIQNKNFSTYTSGGVRLLF
jgi:hypothetical protein